MKSLDPQRKQEVKRAKGNSSRKFLPCKSKEQMVVMRTHVKKSDILFALVSAAPGSRQVGPVEC